MLQRVALGMLLWVLVSGSFVNSAHGQGDLVLELSTGRSFALSSYITDAVYLEEPEIFLVDETPGSGAHLDLSFALNNISFGLGVHFFDRSQVEIHHEGKYTDGRPLPTTSYQRPDGSIDDSGVQYSAIEPVTRDINSAAQGDLLLTSLHAVYRFYLVRGDFEVFLPVGAGLAAVSILETAKPVALGGSLQAGLGLSYKVAPPFGVFLIASANGLMTPLYGTLSDTARNTSLTDRSTESTLISTMAYASAVLGVQFTIR